MGQRKGSKFKAASYILLVICSLCHEHFLLRNTNMLMTGAFFSITLASSCYGTWYYINGIWLLLTLEPKESLHGPFTVLLLVWLDTFEACSQGDCGEGLHIGSQFHIWGGGTFFSLFIQAAE